VSKNRLTPHLGTSYVKGKTTTDSLSPVLAGEIEREGGLAEVERKRGKRKRKKESCWNKLFKACHSLTIASRVKNLNEEFLSDHHFFDFK